MGHGWVIKNPDGAVARCGGPAICSTCMREKAALEAQQKGSTEMGIANSHKDESREVSSRAAQFHAELASLDLHTHGAIVQVLGQLLQHRAQHMQMQGVRDQQMGTQVIAATGMPGMPGMGRA